jgi:dTDP-4-dehydrorhamnose reductase
MRILVTGHTGLLEANSCPSWRPAGHEVHGCSLPGPRHHRSRARPKGGGRSKAELVLHAAAWTAVDECEKDPERAYRVNGLGTRNMVLAARDANAAVAVLSTDYVFDGTKDGPYVEFDGHQP